MPRIFLLIRLGPCTRPLLPIHACVESRGGLPRHRLTLNLGGRPAGFRRAPLDKHQSVYKPGSGWHAKTLRIRDGHSSWTPVTRRLQQPTRTAVPDIDLSPGASHPASRRPYSVLLPVGFALPPALPPARCALTAPFTPCRGCATPRGGSFSVALSLGSRPPDVLRHRLSMEPGLPPRQPFGFAGAAVRPADENRDGEATPGVKGPEIIG